VNGTADPNHRQDLPNAGQPQLRYVTRKDMSQEALKVDITRKALELCCDRIRNKRQIALPEILDSIKSQLEWQLEFFEGRNSERGKLRKLVYGHFAARELGEEDPEFITALARAFYVASRTAEGLKIDEKLV
jgi:hypothetical protein